jgi:Na+/H+ antiporter NhaD/arsenite permease-like protein
VDSLVVAVFVAVYVGMIAGRVPGLRIDRSGIALLGAIVVVAAGRLDTRQAWQAIDAETIALLLGLMVVSAQLRLGGFYTAVARRIAGAALGPEALLGLLCAVVGLLAALLSNDVVCLAMAPVLVQGCVRRGLDPVPFLLALAAAANVGSAATLIGNPQNMLIGAALDLSFAGYLGDALVPSVLGCATVWWWGCRCYRGRFERRLELAVPAEVDRPFDRWQTGKGLAVLGLLVLAFLFAPLPREVSALAAAGLLLLSRRMHSREMLGLVDWQLCVLFAGLFIVHAALTSTGLPAEVLAGLEGTALDPTEPAVLGAATVVLSNLVSNVPAVMLMLPAVEDPAGGALLALSSTLAGNLLLVGSIANLIVVEQARALGVAPRRRSWALEHLRFGLPVTALTLVPAAAWVWAFA